MKSSQPNLNSYRIQAPFSFCLQYLSMPQTIKVMNQGIQYPQLLIYMPIVIESPQLKIIAPITCLHRYLDEINFAAFITKFKQSFSKTIKSVETRQVIETLNNYLNRVLDLPKPRSKSETLIIPLLEHSNKLRDMLKQWDEENTPNFDEKFKDRVLKIDFSISDKYVASAFSKKYPFRLIGENQTFQFTNPVQIDVDLLRQVREKYGIPQNRNQVQPQKFPPKDTNKESPMSVSTAPSVKKTPCIEDKSSAKIAKGQQPPSSKHPTQQKFLQKRPSNVRMAVLEQNIRDREEIKVEEKRGGPNQLPLPGYGCPATEYLYISNEGSSNPQGFNDGSLQYLDNEDSVEYYGSPVSLQKIKDFIGDPNLNEYTNMNARLAFTQQFQKELPAVSTNILEDMDNFKEQEDELINEEEEDAQRIHINKDRLSQNLLQEQLLQGMQLQNVTKAVLDLQNTFGTRMQQWEQQYSMMWKFTDLFPASYHRTVVNQLSLNLMPLEEVEDELKGLQKQKSDRHYRIYESGFDGEDVSNEAFIVNSTYDFTQNIRLLFEEKITQEEQKKLVNTSEVHSGSNKKLGILCRELRQKEFDSQLQNQSGENQQLSGKRKKRQGQVNQSTFEKKIVSRNYKAEDLNIAQIDDLLSRVWHVTYITPALTLQEKMQMQTFMNYALGAYQVVCEFKDKEGPITGSPFYDSHYFRLMNFPHYIESTQPGNFMPYLHRNSQQAFNTYHLFTKEIQNQRSDLPYLDSLIGLLCSLCDGAVYPERTTLLMLISGLLQIPGQMVVSKMFLNPFKFPLARVLSWLVIDEHLQNYDVKLIAETVTEENSTPYQLPCFSYIFIKNRERIQQILNERGSIIIEFVYFFKQDCTPRSQFFVVRENEYSYLLFDNKSNQHVMNFPRTKLLQNSTLSIAMTLLFDLLNQEDFIDLTSKLYCTRFYSVTVQEKMPRNLLLQYDDFQYVARNFFLKLCSMHSYDAIKYLVRDIRNKPLRYLVELLNNHVAESQQNKGLDFMPKSVLEYRAKRQAYPKSNEYIQMLIELFSKVPALDRYKAKLQKYFARISDPVLIKYNPFFLINMLFQIGCTVNYLNQSTSKIMLSKPQIDHLREQLSCLRLRIRQDIEVSFPEMSRYISSLSYNSDIENQVLPKLVWRPPTDLLAAVGKLAYLKELNVDDLQNLARGILIMRRAPEDEYDENEKVPYVSDFCDLDYLFCEKDKEKISSTPANQYIISVLNYSLCNGGYVSNNSFCTHESIFYYIVKFLKLSEDPEKLRSKQRLNEVPEGQSVDHLKLARATFEKMLIQYLNGECTQDDLQPSLNAAFDSNQGQADIQSSELASGNSHGSNQNNRSQQQAMNQSRDASVIISHEIIHIDKEVEEVHSIGLVKNEQQIHEKIIDKFKDEMKEVDSHKQVIPESNIQQPVNYSGNVQLQRGVQSCQKKGERQTMKSYGAGMSSNVNLGAHSKQNQFMRKQHVAQSNLEKAMVINKVPESSNQLQQRTTKVATTQKQWNSNTQMVMKHGLKPSTTKKVGSTHSQGSQGLRPQQQNIMPGQQNRPQLLGSCQNQFEIESRSQSPQTQRNQNKSQSQVSGQGSYNQIQNETSYNHSNSYPIGSEQHSNQEQQNHSQHPAPFGSLEQSNLHEHSQIDQQHDARQDPNDNNSNLEPSDNMSNVHEATN